MESMYKELLEKLLAERGIVSDVEREIFLSPDYVRDTHSPFLMRDMQKAVERIMRAIDTNERIAVYADFDCDGIPGAALLYDFFRIITYMNVETYIPHRDLEGYGLHIEAIKKLQSRGVTLIITVDVGTVAVEAVAYAQAQGIDVIVSDHHEVIGSVAPAYAIVNPKIPPYPYPDLCGTGVAFKLVQGLISYGKEKKYEHFLAIPSGWEKWLLDLVAMATVADMVPLTGENRVLVHWGLKVLRKSRRAGIDALCNELRIRKENLSEEDIGFSIAPRVNAASRMDSPELSFELLTTSDSDRARELSTILEGLNAKRKGVVSAMVKSVRKVVASRYNENDKVVVAGDTTWKPALLGLAANSIMQERGGVVCLWGRDGKGNLKGSCRSDGTISLVDLFTVARDSFVACGGHAMSGGFEVSHENIHTLPEQLKTAVENIVPNKKTNDTVESSAILTLSEISFALWDELNILSPYGMENRKPIFSLRNVIIKSVRMFGKEKNHIEITMVDQGSMNEVRAFQFFKSPEQFTHIPTIGGKVNLLATLERDTFRGAYSVALRIIDVLK